jgi:hypothetical protein
MHTVQYFETNNKILILVCDFNQPFEAESHLNNICVHSLPQREHYTLLLRR